MSNLISVPEGWKPLDYTELSRDSGKPEKNLELITPGPIGKDETDYHSQYVSPESEFGAVSSGTGERSSYGGEGTDQEKPESGPDLRDVGQIQLEDGEHIVEDGMQKGYHYYLVANSDKEYFYSVIPKLRNSKEAYKSPHKTDRKDALEAAYKIFNVTLPESVGDQMHYRYPEREI